jgi:signal transduction histidine kinase
MPTAARPPRRAFPAWFLPPAIALGLVALFVGQILIQARVFHLAVDLPTVLTQSFTRWFLYAALAPVLGAFVARYPLEPGRLGRWPAHVAFLALVACAHSVGMAIVYRIFHVYPRQDSIGQAIVHLVFTFFASNMTILGAVSGVYHAVRYHREALRRGEVAATLTARLAEARLDALRGQLRPHFLFNTLNAVAALVLAGEREAVITMLSRLGDVLRTSLDRSLPQEITAEAELALLRPYLDVQRTRFGERLSVAIELGEGATGARVPSLVLLPLVENALRHGVEARPGPGRVRIAIARAGDTLRIRVEDSGPGFSVPAHAPGFGIGLENTRARLAQLHGDRQSVVCGDLPDRGAFVEITLPYESSAPAPAIPAEAGARRTA